MSKRKGYRFARFAPFPLGSLGVSAVRNPVFSQESPLHRAAVSVFMPPMKDVTINVTSCNAGRFHLSTDGLIPVISSKIDKGVHYLYLMDQDKQVSPFSIANVFDNGEVCWGPNGQPFSLRAAWEEFFTRPFNTDLTPIKDDDDTDQRRRRIVDEYRSAWVMNNSDKMEPWLSKIFRIPSIQRHVSSGYTGPAYGGDVERSITQMFRGGMSGDYRTLLTGVAPSRYTTRLLGKFPYHFSDGSIDMVHYDAKHDVKNADQSQLNWSPNNVRERYTHIVNTKSRIESRRRTRAAAAGKTWSGVAAHDPTWVATLRYEQRWLEKYRMVGHPSPGSFEQQLGVGYGWRRELSKKVMDPMTVYIRDELEYGIPDHVNLWFDWKLRSKAPDPAVGCHPYESKDQRAFDNPRVRDGEARRRIIDGLRALLEALNKRGPRQLRRFYARWIRMWMKTQVISHFNYRATMTLDHRMVLRFGEPSSHPINFGSIGVDDGLGHGLKANIKRHFLGKWKTTLSFRGMGDLMAPVEQQTFFAAHRFDGMACIPVNVYANACGDERKVPNKISQLQCVSAMKARYFDDNISLRGLSHGIYHYIPALYKRFMDCSVALVQMFWNHDDSVYLYDGRWRMVKVPDGATVEEVERMARDLDTTEQWGIGRPTVNFGASDVDKYGYRKSVFTPDSDKMKAEVERSFSSVPVS